VSPRHLPRLLAAAPRDGEALKLRATLRGESGLWELALRDWDALCELGGANWYERGNAQAQLGRWDEAEQDFTRAAKESREPEKALNALALLHWRQGREDAGRDACKRLSARGQLTPSPIFSERLFLALTATPDAPVEWAFLNNVDPLGVYQPVLGALLYRRGGRDAEALRKLDLDEQALPHSVINTAALGFLRALVHHRLGQADEARTALAQSRRALTGVPRDQPDLARAPESWQEKVYAELLEREAAKAIEGK
jgi:tetratricopeptide (TPR) repeat protein